MKLGSMGEIPPSTSGKSGFSRRTARLAAVTISANILQSLSSLKSQWDRLLGSFHSITASTIRHQSAMRKTVFRLLKRACEFVIQNVFPFLHDLSGTANPRFRLRVRLDFQARAAQHAFHGAVVRDPPVGRVPGVLVLDEIHAGEIRPLKDLFVPEVVIVA